MTSLLPCTICSCTVHCVGFLLNASITIDNPLWTLCA